MAPGDPTDDDTKGPSPEGSAQVSAWQLINNVGLAISTLTMGWLVFTGRLLPNRGGLRRPDPERGSTYVVPASAQERARELVSDGRRIDAIKEIRQATDLPLDAAMDIVAALRTGAILPTTAVETDDHRELAANKAEPERVSMLWLIPCRWADDSLMVRTSGWLNWSMLAIGFGFGGWIVSFALSRAAGTNGWFEAVVMLSGSLLPFLLAGALVYVEGRGIWLRRRRATDLRAGTMSDPY